MKETKNMKTLIKTGKQIWNSLNYETKDKYYCTTGTIGFVENTAKLLDIDINKLSNDEFMYCHDMIFKPATQDTLDLLNQQIENCEQFEIEPTMALQAYYFIMNKIKEAEDSEIYTEDGDINFVFTKNGIQCFDITKPEKPQLVSQLKFIEEIKR